MLEIRQVDLNRDASQKCRQKGTVYLFGRRKYQTYRNRMPLRGVAYPINFTTIEPGKELLLPFGAQPVDFIQK
ncbi:Uncharacterised protein [Salmonella enterica subsp. enterica serovar Bovismorbificans]|nr:Uncharacterised protein [Salmonella enterica subsp. enterica serovar Bovismorbificans]